MRGMRRTAGPPKTSRLLTVLGVTQVGATVVSAQTAIPNLQTTTSPEETATASLSILETVCFTPANIFPFAFTPDSQSLLVRGMTDVRKFDLDTSQKKLVAEVPQNIITAALSPDGKIVAWSLEDNSNQVVRISDQQTSQTLSGHSDMVAKLRFTPDGEQLVSASHDGWVKVWNMQGDLLRSFQPPGGALGIGISPDGSLLATVPSDGPLTLWDLDTLQKIKEMGGSGGFDTSDAEFSADGQIVAADLPTGLYLWRVSDGKPIWAEGKNSMVVSFSPDGRFLAYTDNNQVGKIFLSTTDGSQIVQEMAGQQAPVWELFFSPDSQLLASSDGSEIRIWQVEDGTLGYIGKATCP